MATFCQDCGAELASQYRICPSCGGRNLAPHVPQRNPAGPPSALWPQIIPQPISNLGPLPQPAQPQASIPNTRSMAYAGFWVRLVAILIDTMILMIPLAAIELLLAGAGGDENLGATILALLLETFIFWLYFALQECSEKQATLGKRALRLVVCDMNGNRLRLGRATGRHFAKLLSFLILGIGYLMVGFTDRKQGLHDKVAGTVVLRRPTD